MKQQTPEEMLQNVVERLAMKYWNYSFEPNDWFFASELAPHSASFKYRCKKLYELGMLEKQGDSSARWGCRYRVPPEITTP